MSLACLKNETISVESIQLDVVNMFCKLAQEVFNATGAASSSMRSKKIASSTCIRVGVISPSFPQTGFSFGGTAEQLSFWLLYCEHHSVYR